MLITLLTLWKKNALDKQEFNITFGKRFAEIRKSKKISQEELASQLSLTRSSIVNIEKGRQQLNLFQLWRTSEIFNIGIEKFFEGVIFSSDKIVSFGQNYNKSTIQSLANFVKNEH